MPSNQTMEQAFREYSLYITGRLAEVGVEAIKQFSQELSEDIQADYDSFFEELYGILSPGVTSTPSRLLQNMGGEAPWRNLSRSWNERKGDNKGLFYKGLTDRMYKAKVNARDKRKRGAKGRLPNKPTSFMDFLKKKSDRSAAEVKRLFGPLEISYMLQGAGMKTPVDINQKGNVISSIGRITTRNSKGQFIPRLGNVQLEANIMAFPYIKKVQDFSEWYVVDYLARKDAGNRAQWRKVNSRVTPKGGIRPMRAIITPLISWFLTTKFRQNFQGRFL